MSHVSHSRIKSFVDWDKRHSCHPSEIYYPSSVGEVVEVIQSNSGSKVKVVGAGHSFSPIMLTNGVMISLDNMQQFLSPSVDDNLLPKEEDPQLVTVEAGMRVWQLNEYLAKLGLAMENLGAITEQSVAGAISTSTHGTGGLIGSMATAVRGLKFVTANGTVVSASVHNEPELFHASVVGLGAMGVVVEVTLRVVPAFKMKRVQTQWYLDELWERVPKMLSHFDRLQWYWIPYEAGKSATLLTRERTTKDLSPVGIGCWNGPKAVTPMCIDHSYRVMSRDGRQGPLFTEMEQFIPIEHCMDALNEFRVFQEKPETIAQHNPEQMLFTGVRYVAADEHWMSMMYQRDICVISFIVWGTDAESGDPKEFQFYARELERISHKYGGRPHWGKMNWANTEYLRRVYPRHADFERLRHSMDSNDMFMNQYLEERLQ
eukprot:CFRG0238T1